jgi:hypothetical protein
MKKINILLILLYITITLFVIECKAQLPKPAPQIEYCTAQRLWFSISDDLLNKIAYLESKFDTCAIGDSGKALGMFQIWEIYIQEHNRLYGTKYTHYHAYHVPTARSITHGVLFSMAMNFYKNEGTLPNEVQLLMMHNGGYNGYKRNTSLPYIQRYYSEIVTKKLHLQK